MRSLARGWRDCVGLGVDPVIVTEIIIRSETPKKKKKKKTNVHTQVLEILI